MRDCALNEIAVELGSNWHTTNVVLDNLSAHMATAGQRLTRRPETETLSPPLHTDQLEPVASALRTVSSRSLSRGLRHERGYLLWTLASREGSLIQAMVGSAGGVGRRRRKRSG